MRGNVLTAVAIIAILGITCVTVLEDSGDVEAATGDVIITSASGTIGTGVNWSFSDGTLTITQATGTGSKTIATGLDSDSTITSGWGSTWKVTGHTESTPSTGGGDESQTPASTTNTKPGTPPQRSARVRSRTASLSRKSILDMSHP